MKTTPNHNYQSKKYHLLYILHQMPVERYRYVMQQIPLKLNISESLGRKWIYLDKEDAYKIPYSLFVSLVKLLGKEDIIFLSHFMLNFSIGWRRGFQNVTQQ